MKIALSAPADIHGIAGILGLSTAGIPRGLGSTAITPLILELLKRGHDVTLYTTCWELVEHYQATWGNLRLFVVPARPRGSGRDFFKLEIDGLEQVIRADRPEWVSAHWTYEFALAPLRAGVPTLTSIHDLPWKVFRYFRDPFRLVRLLMAYDVAVRGTDFTAVSSEAASHFRRWLRPFARPTIIPNFLPDAVMQMVTRPSIHPDRPLVFASTLGSWTELKNPKGLLRAFSKFEATNVGTRLILFGHDFVTGGPAEAWARSNNVAESVIFFGGVPHADMLQYLRDNVDVLVVPSLNESFSMSALEGMSLGKPVIAGHATEGVTEVLDYGNAGLLTDVTSTERFASAMQQLQSDAALYGRLATAGYRRARTQYVASVVVPQYEDVFATFAEKSLRRAGKKFVSKKSTQDA